MTPHPPAVGVLPQPTQGNVQGINKLLGSKPPQVPSGPFDLWTPEEVSLFRCDACQCLFCFNAGNMFLDDFFCECCFWQIMAKGGICDGN